MDERTLKFKIGDLVEWTELCAEGLLIKEKGLGIIVEKYKQFYRVHRPIQQDIVKFNMNEIESINKQNVY